MKSQADIIYNHIEKQKGDFVIPIEINTDDFDVFVSEYTPYIFISWS